MPAGAPKVGPGSPSDAENVRAAQASVRGGKYSYPASFRLKTPADFRRVLRSGHRRSDALFTVITLPRSGSSPRLGLAVARRVSGSAVARNRIKRLIREQFRLHREHLPGVDIMVLARGPAAASANRAITHSLDRHFQQIQRTCAG